MQVVATDYLVSLSFVAMNNFTSTQQVALLAARF
jgi:hypothetical protein